MYSSSLTFVGWTNQNLSLDFKAKTEILSNCVAEYLGKSNFYEIHP